MASTWGLSWGTSWGGSWGLLTATGGPSRAHKEEKKKSYRDTPVDWNSPLAGQIQQKKLETINVSKKIQYTKKQRLKSSQENNNFFETELSELYKLLEELLAELEKLTGVDFALGKLSKAQRKELQKAVPDDDFEDLFFILKFVLKRI